MRPSSLCRNSGKGMRRALPFLGTNGEQRQQQEDVKPKKRNWGGCICATSVVSVVVAIVAIILALIAMNSAGKHGYVRLYEASTEIAPAPFSINLGRSLLAMTLPNSLAAFQGVPYSICSVTNDAHTVTIDTGTLSTTWDGTHRIATFPGTKGACLLFRVVDSSTITVLSNPGGAVLFS